MSVEVTKPVEETPVTKPVPVAEPTEAPVSETPALATEPATTTAATEPAVETIKTSDDKVVVEATAASEGQLGYKAPGFLKQFVFSKQYFWLKEEPSTAESLKPYLSHEKPEVAHSHSAWAQETSTGVLYHAKRDEDKTHPLGLILLADASNVVKEGATEFSFIVNKKAHRFEAATTAERDSWIVAIEKQIEESKAIKEEVTGRESYKKTLEDFAAAPVAAAATAKTERSTSKAPKKSLDATTATAVAAEPVAKDETASVSSSDKEKKAEKAAKKERSQSRKRQSVFGGIFGKKDEDKELKKAEAEQIKADKHTEAEVKKEEAKETHEAAPAVEAVEAAAVAAAPAAVVAAVETKKEEKHVKEAEAEAASPTEKSKKRSSVFGGLFGKKVTSPVVEKTEKEATAPVESTEVPPVSETAPKLDEPIENKPIDAAAVTAPVDTVETPAAIPAVTTTTEEPATEAVAPAAETPAGKSEKKSGLLAFIKKNDPRKEQKEVLKEIKKEEAEEKKAAEPISAAAAPVTTTEGVTETAAVETPVADTTADERATREKRRSSFFGLGSKKKPVTATDAADTEGSATPEVKREKSPLPARLGGLFRRSSRVVKPAETEAAATEAETAPAETAAVGAPATEATVTGTTDSQIVGDKVPDELHTTVHDATTIPAPAEVKASA